MIDLLHYFVAKVLFFSSFREVCINILSLPNISDVLLLKRKSEEFQWKKKSSQNYLLIIYTTCNNHPVVVALIAFWLVSLNVSFPAVFRNQLTR